MNNLNQNVFNKYSRKGLSELTPFKTFVGDMTNISISEQDKLLSNEEFELGYIARNPKNHLDMWYVAKKYFDDNLELYIDKTTDVTETFTDRLVKEYDELKEKTTKLYEFLQTPNCHEIVSEKQHDLLKSQYSSMQNYLNTLFKRIKDLNTAHNPYLYK